MNVTYDLFICYISYAASLTYPVLLNKKQSKRVVKANT